MFQTVEEIHIHGMHIAVHHHNDGQSHAHFSRRYHHDKEYEQLSFAAGRCVGHGQLQVMHLGESHQQQVHGIQHKLNAHEDDDRVAARKDPYDPYGE